MVQIDKAGTGKCAWCCKENQDGVTARFSDGLNGHFCWKDFRAAVKVRSPKQGKEEARAQGAGGSRTPSP